MRKIAIMGPESTGKSIITQQLANHYKTVWVPEFARQYCEVLKEPVTLKNELEILKGQLILENSILPFAKQLLFCDTMFLTVKIYSNHVFNTYPRELDEYLKIYHYDFFLIMNIDLPWQDDPLREFPKLRKYFLDIHLLEIEKLNVPFTLISGIGRNRFENAKKNIDQFLKINM
jgi:nicotinamide riboside kinase